MRGSNNPWAGQISTVATVELCKRYDPEQVLLVRTRLSSNWAEFLRDEYQVVAADQSVVLYIHRRINDKMDKVQSTSSDE